MLEEAKMAGKAYIDNIEAAEEKAGEEIVKAGGIIKEFPASELAKWKAAAPDLLQNWVEDMTSRNMGEEAGKVSAYWRAIINAN
jgi:TRAP-type C4-dicarboxylate transport system substrate-binding protein